ncbi:hypothetical protein GWI33_015252 [Rhynchophorus ferrugineus]|uniref:Uncharacterized protein n=1 Tax=Rhynchophorus ferrugineus TaxID=354439 RepID=A0A834I065_RHYFE|nr:hypothetical protein GWI33_015252 [Rhynchophorus ferrugineus]
MVVRSSADVTREMLRALYANRLHCTEPLCWPDTGEQTPRDRPYQLVRCNAGGVAGSRSLSSSPPTWTVR